LYDNHRQTYQADGIDRTQPVDMQSLDKPPPPRHAAAAWYYSFVPARHSANIDPALFRRIARHQTHPRQLCTDKLLIPQRERNDTIVMAHPPHK